LRSRARRAPPRLEKKKGGRRKRERNRERAKVGSRGRLHARTIEGGFTKEVKEAELSSRGKTRKEPDERKKSALISKTERGTTKSHTIGEIEKVGGYIGSELNLARRHY